MQRMWKILMAAAGSILTGCTGVGGELRARVGNADVVISRNPDGGVTIGVEGGKVSGNVVIPPAHTQPAAVVGTSLE